MPEKFELSTDEDMDDFLWASFKSMVTTYCGITKMHANEVIDALAAYYYETDK